MNTKQLCILVDHHAQHSPTFGKAPEELYTDLHRQFGLHPVNLTWGATCLYIDLPDEVRLSVHYRR